jgi:anthranilate synthase/phosphoribosyltransferase
LGIKTIMNLVGPLSNPADAPYQIIGVYDAALLKPVAEAARLLGVKRVMTMRSRDGMDEISPCAPTDIVEIGEDGTTKEYVFDPRRRASASTTTPSSGAGTPWTTPGSPGTWPAAPEGRPWRPPRPSTPARPCT